MSILDSPLTKQMLSLCTPFSLKIDENRKREGYKNQSSRLLPFYKYIDNHYNFDWKFQFKNGNDEGIYQSKFSKYAESHILVSSKGSIIHIFALNDFNRNPIEKDISLSMHPFGISNDYLLEKLNDNTIHQILTNKISHSSHTNATILISKYEQYDKCENTIGSLDENIVKIVNFAPFGNISTEYLTTLFDMFQLYLSKQENEDFVQVIKSD
jgi:hypothetical protein